MTYKNGKRGRPAANGPVEKAAVVQDRFYIDLRFNPRAYDHAVSRAGYYPLVTNHPVTHLSIKDAMMAHKNQYKVEHIYRRSKSGYRLEPIYLHTPERIETYLFLFKIALQIVVLIERAARQNIQARGKGLNDFMPNKRLPDTQSGKSASNVRTCGLRADASSRWSQLWLRFGTYRSAKRHLDHSRCARLLLLL